jgi:hypothetical protein
MTGAKNPKIDCEKCPFGDYCKEKNFGLSEQGKEANCPLTQIVLGVAYCSNGCKEQSQEAKPTQPLPLIKADRAEVLSKRLDAINTEFRFANKNKAFDALLPIVKELIFLLAEKPKEAPQPIEH